MRADGRVAARRRSRATLNGRNSLHRQDADLRRRSEARRPSRATVSARRSHDDDDPLGVGCAVVLEQPVARGRSARRTDPSPPARCRARRGRNGWPPRGSGRRRRGSAPCRAPPDGPASARAPRCAATAASSTSARSVVVVRARRSSRLRATCGSRRRSARTGLRDAERRGVRDRRRGPAPPAPTPRRASRSRSSAPPSRRCGRRRSTARAWRPRAR